MMIRTNRTLRFLVIVLAVIMLPLFMGLVCPCAQAAAPATTVIQNVPCHGCCPQMSMGNTDCQAGVLQQPVALNPARFSGFLSGKDSGFEIFLSTSQNQVSLLHGEADVSSPPVYPLHGSLVVLNQVFRI